MLLVVTFAETKAQENVVTIPESDAEKSNWNVTQEGNTTTLQYNGNRRVKSVKLCMQITVTAKLPIYSRVSCTDGGSLESYEPKFNNSHITNNVKMEVSGEGIENSSIPLKSIDSDGNGVFEGLVEVTSGMIANGTPLDGTIKIVGTINSSINSMDDLLNNCSHNYSTVGMTYGTTDVVSLSDDKAYFEAIMSPLQQKLMVNSVDYPVNTSNGKVWIALDAGSPIEMNFYHKPSNEVTAGTIYTLDRNGYVDLGLGVLWADKNLGTNSYDGYGNYYDCDAPNNGIVQSPARVPSTSDFKKLLDACYRERYGNDGNWKFYRKLQSGDDYSDEPYIIIPAAGYIYNGQSLTQRSDVWVRSNTAGKCLAYVNSWALWQGDYDLSCDFNLPVRPVLGFSTNSVTDFNTAENSNPILNFTEDVTDLVEITRKDGVIDLNGHTLKLLYLQNNVEGETVIVRNGTISQEIDGQGGFDDYYKGTVVLENMNVTQIWTDGHNFIINSGTYGKIINIKDQGAPGSVTINGGCFEQLAEDPNLGTYTINGGKFKQNLATMLSDLNITIPSGKNIYDNGEDEEYRYEVR